MPGRINHVQREGLAINFPGQAHGLRLDGDSALALDVHAIEVLGAHRPVIHNARDLKHAVGKGRFAVVDVRNDAEISNLRWTRRRGLQRGRSSR